MIFLLMDRISHSRIPVEGYVKNSFVFMNSSCVFCFSVFYCKHHGILWWMAPLNACKCKWFGIKKYTYSMYTNYGVSEHINKAMCLFHTHTEFLRPAMWVSYYTVPLWLLQVIVLLRALWGYSDAIVTEDFEWIFYCLLLKIFIQMKHLPSTKFYP